jgi:hypothetical protein
VGFGCDKVIANCAVMADRYEHAVVDFRRVHKPANETEVEGIGSFSTPTAQKAGN